MIEEGERRAGVIRTAVGDDVNGDVGHVGVGWFACVVATICGTGFADLETADRRLALICGHSHSSAWRVVIYHRTVAIPEDVSGRGSRSRNYAA